MEKKKILFVDDEKDFLKITKINLESTGKYSVETMFDATTGVISLVKMFNPHVIILDLLMPKIGGVEVCKMLNGDPVARCIPIIALTALDTVKDKNMMYSLGVVDFVIKPIGIDDLIAKIEKALQPR